MATKQSIFDISEDFRRIRDQIIAAEGTGSEEIFNTLKAVRMTGEEKITQCYFLIQQWQTEIEAAKDAEAVANKHRKSRENSIEIMKKRMLDLAAELGIDRIDNPHCRITVCDGKRTLKIPDINALDTDYIKTETVIVEKPKMEEIEAAINAGKEVAGATIEPGEKFLKFFKPKK